MSCITCFRNTYRVLCLADVLVVIILLLIMLYSYHMVCQSLVNTLFHPLMAYLITLVGSSLMLLSCLMLAC